MVFGLGCQRKMVEKSSTPDEQRVGKNLPFKKLECASFSKSEKLLLKADFSAVFSNPHWRVSANPLRMLCRRNDLGLSRIGIIVPKKIVRLATSRNRHKRVIREEFRLVKKRLPNVDIVLVLKKRVCEKELMQSCERIWKFLIHEIDD
jgi:ribonuclease P protein component